MYLTLLKTETKCLLFLNYLICYPVSVTGEEGDAEPLTQEDPPTKDDTDTTELEILSSVSQKKDIPILTLNSSEGEEENTSFLCSQNSEKEEDLVMLRQPAIRKLKCLVDKCCLKWIKFSQKFFNINKCLANNPKSVTDDELTELCTECLESLETYNVSFTSSSTSESAPEEHVNIRKKKVKCAKTLVQSPPMYDPTNPYNVQYQMDPRYTSVSWHEACKHLSRLTHASSAAMHHAHTHYPYSHTSMYNPYPDNVYSEYEHHQKSSVESQHQAQRQTASYPGYCTVASSTPTSERHGT